MIKHIEFMVFGALIIFFLIVEPHGFARLWQIAKQKLRGPGPSPTDATGSNQPAGNIPAASLNGRL